MATVDASGIDCSDLVHAMWMQCPSDPYGCARAMETFDRDECIKELERNEMVIEYVCGRAIMTDFGNMSALDPWFYEHNCRHDMSCDTGALARIVARLRSAALTSDIASLHIV